MRASPAADVPRRRLLQEPGRQLPQSRRIIIVAAQSAAEADGIRDYTNRLAAELDSREGWEVDVCLKAPGDRLQDAVQAAVGDVVLVQYNPFWYARWGFAPSLPFALWRVKRRDRPLIALMVHETFVEMSGWRWTLMGAWQRLQLAALQPVADVRFCSIQAWTETLRRMWPYTPVHHLPVASNFPDMRSHRSEQRMALGASDDTVVLACFGMSHPGRLPRYVVRAAREVASVGKDVLLLNLGTRVEASGDCNHSVKVHAPGYLGHTAVARLLSAADVFLAPYADGVSTRRTTVMTALQHEIAVVGTEGHLTDDLLREADHAMVLTPAGSQEAFAEAVRSLASNVDRRHALGRQGRLLYETHFAWARLTAGLLAALDSRACRP